MADRRLSFVVCVLYRYGVHACKTNEHVRQSCPTRGLRRNKFVSRLYIFGRLKYICYQNTRKWYLLFLLWAYHPKTCVTNASKIYQFFRFGLHPYKLATIGLIITLCYRIKLIKIKGFVTSQKRLRPAINFLMVNVARTTKKVGQAWCTWQLKTQGYRLSMCVCVRERERERRCYVAGNRYTPNYDEKPNKIHSMNRKVFLFDYTWHTNIS